MNSFTVLLLRLVLCSPGIWLVWHAARIGEPMLVIPAMMVAVGLFAMLVPRALFDAASDAWDAWRHALWAPEDGRWRTFRGIPVALRFHDGDLWVRWQDVERAWQTPISALQPAVHTLPGERGDFARVSLVLRCLRVSERVPQPRQAAFLLWLAREADPRRR
jgi:hypothetical protein